MPESIREGLMFELHSEWTSSGDINARCQSASSKTSFFKMTTFQTSAGRPAPQITLQVTFCLPYHIHSFKDKPFYGKDN